MRVRKETKVIEKSSLDGRVALVTGASRGLGAVIARQLGGLGAAVCINYLRNQCLADEVAIAIRDAGSRAIAVQADVREHQSVLNMANEVKSRLGPVSIIIHCAVEPERPAKIEEQTWADYLEQMEYAVKAPLLLLQAFLPEMRSNGWGRIVCLGSEMGRLGQAYCSPYASAKAALSGLARSWAHAVGQNGITVNVVAPGWTPVERHASASQESLAAYASTVPMSRIGTASEVAAVVAFLASDRAGFITGQTIAVDGGHTMA